MPEVRQCRSPGRDCQWKTLVEMDKSVSLVRGDGERGAWARMSVDLFRSTVFPKGVIHMLRRSPLRAIFPIAGVLLMVGLLSAQPLTTGRIDSATTPVAEQRFEVVQAGVHPDLIVLRVDRWSGRTDRLTVDSGRPGWKRLRWDDRSASGNEASSVRFQVYTAGVSARNILLYDIVDGASWYLESPSSGDPFWRAVDERS